MLSLKEFDASNFEILILKLLSKECIKFTGKSLSEALLFAEHGENVLCTKIVLNVRKNLELGISCIELVIQ